jgi:hypothetical protein
MTAVVFVALAAAHWLSWLLLAAAAVGARYWLGLRARPAAKLTTDNAELARLRAELGQARTELRDAQASAAAAWDAAASVPPKTTRPAPGREQLLADPRAGVHDLGGGAA